jgi:hypothetical protein
MKRRLSSKSGPTAEAAPQPVPVRQPKKMRSGGIEQYETVHARLVELAETIERFKHFSQPSSDGSDVDI